MRRGWQVLFEDELNPELCQARCGCPRECFGDLRRGLRLQGQQVHSWDRWVIPKECRHSKKSVCVSCTVKFDQAVRGALCGAPIGPGDLV